MAKGSNQIIPAAAAGVVSVCVLLSSPHVLAAGASRNVGAQTSSAQLVAQAATAPTAPGVSTPAPVTPGQETQQPGNVPAQPPGGPIERVEIRISNLHEKLRITPAQEPQFKAYADMMRSNAQAMQALLQQEVQDAEATAVNVLRSYERLTATHAEAMTKLVPIFETLYISLSEEQKKVADKIFQPIEQRRARRSAG